MSSEMIFTSITSGLNIEAIEKARSFADNDFTALHKILESSDDSILLDNLMRMRENVEDRKSKYDEYTDEQLLDYFQKAFDDSQKLEIKYKGDFRRFIPKILKKYPDLELLLSGLVFDNSIARGHNNWAHSLSQLIVASHA